MRLTVTVVLSLLALASTLQTFEGELRSVAIDYFVTSPEVSIVHTAACQAHLYTSACLL